MPQHDNNPYAWVDEDPSGFRSIERHVGATTDEHISTKRAKPVNHIISGRCKQGDHRKCGNGRCVCPCHFPKEAA